MENLHRWFALLPGGKRLGSFNSATKAIEPDCISPAGACSFRDSIK